MKEKEKGRKEKKKQSAELRLYVPSSLIPTHRSFPSRCSATSTNPSKLTQSLFCNLSIDSRNPSPSSPCVVVFKCCALSGRGGGSDGESGGEWSCWPTRCAMLQLTVWTSLGRVVPFAIVLRLWGVVDGGGGGAGEARTAAVGEG